MDSLNHLIRLLLSLYITYKEMNIKLRTTAEFSTSFTFLGYILKTASDFSCDAECPDGGFL